MAKHTKTLNIIEIAREVLSQHKPMTVRQVYYRLVSRQVIKNSRTEYQAVSNALVSARKEGVIPWGWIEDRLRMPREVSMWEGLANFAETAKRAYRRDVWATQPAYLEVWLEKDALSGIFQNVLNGFGVTLNVGRGYDGWSSIYNAAQRFGDGQGVTILYFGDFDPSGVQMGESLQERLAELGSSPELVRSALNPDDIALYNLPPDFTKKTDTRAPKFIAKHGDVAVELDALPPEVLEQRIRQEVEQRLDLGALAAVKDIEVQERQRLADMLSSA